MKKNYFKSLMQVALLLAAPFVVSSCDDIIGQEDNPVASYVQWKNDPGAEVVMKIGDKKVIATATAVSSAIIAYTSSDEKVATIDPVTAEIEALAVGETTISAVISGMSTNGRSVFEPTEVSFKLIVKDGKAKLTRTQDAVIEYTANVDSIIDLSKLFTAYPKIGTGDNESAIAFTAFTYDYDKTTKKYVYNAYTGNKTTLGLLTSAAKTFEVGKELKNTDMTKSGISDTLYIVGTITAATKTNEYDYTKVVDATRDTVKIIINKSIAYMNEKGKRTILTADKYKELDLSATFAVEAGTYYVTAAPTSAPSTATDIKGDVTLIFKNGVNPYLQNIDDKTDNATLNIFGEAIPGATAGTYKAGNPTIRINNSYTVQNAITNFKEININTGTLYVYAPFTNVKDVNVNAGKLNVYGYNDYAMKLSGKLTINGGEVIARGYSSDTEKGFAVIGDVVLNKGSFYAYNDDYRAVNGTLTAASGFEFLQGDTSTLKDATAIKGTTSTSKYIWGQAVPKK